MHDKQISLLSKLGRDTEEVLTTAKNISEFVNTSNSDEIVTRIYATVTFRVGDKDDKKDLQERHREELRALRQSQKEYSQSKNAEKRSQQIQEEIAKKYAKELAKQNKSVKRSGTTSKSYSQIESEVRAKYQVREQKAQVRRVESQAIADRKKSEIESLKAQQKEETASLDQEVTISLVVESPLINDYPFINEISVSNNDLRTAEELEEWAMEYFTKGNIDKPKNSIKVTYEQLSENINRGDTVILKYLKYGVDERIRVVETHYDPMLKKWKEFILGEKEGRLGSEVSHSSSGAEFRANAYTDRLSIDIERKIKDRSENYDKLFKKNSDEITKRIEDGFEKAKASSEVTKAKIDEEKKLAPLREEVNNIVNDFTKGLPERIKENLKGIDIDSAKIDELKTKIEEISEKAETTLKMVGNDGVERFNKNRLDGGTQRDIPLGTPFIEISHNGDGFEVGKPYVISWEATCRTHDNFNVKFVFDRILDFPIKVIMQPTNTFYPIAEKTFTEQEGTIFSVYNGGYNISFESKWYKIQNLFKDITEATTINVQVSYKDYAEGIETADYQGEWNNEPKFIFDGGGN